MVWYVESVETSLDLTTSALHAGIFFMLLSLLLLIGPVDETVPLANILSCFHIFTSKFVLTNSAKEINP